MSIFDSLKLKPQQSAPMSPTQMLQALKQNPVNMLQQAGLNIPEGMTDPQQMVQHLLTSGQITQARYAQAMQAAGRR